jgi:hypothetical protein
LSAQEAKKGFDDAGFRLGLREWTNNLPPGVGFIVSRCRRLLRMLPFNPFSV